MLVLSGKGGIGVSSFGHFLGQFFGFGTQNLQVFCFRIHCGFWFSHFLYNFGFWFLFNE